MLTPIGSLLPLMLLTVPPIDIPVLVPLALAIPAIAIPVLVPGLMTIPAGIPVAGPSADGHSNRRHGR